MGFQRAKRQFFLLTVVLFVPGGCTSVAQPCDLNINQLLKHLIKSRCVAHLAAEATKQLNCRVKPTDVAVDTRPAALQNTSTNWVWHAWQWFSKNPKSIHKAWSLAKFGDWDFSYKCIASNKAYSIVQEEFNENPEFALSLCQQVPDDSAVEDNANNIDYDDDASLELTIIHDLVHKSQSNLPDNITHKDGSFISIFDDA
ncbi:unnamed protein product [Rhizoctonia solani]|uniref:Secreted protein n=1 Tax=Rhizoctonia solani TaxID=456999 RepID=A0A8H2WJD8_9AGAM|nr:unnamed protein product [Rhizoctonia solani]